MPNRVSNKKTGNTPKEVVTFKRELRTPKADVPIELGNTDESEQAKEKYFNIPYPYTCIWCTRGFYHTTHLKSHMQAKHEQVYSEGLETSPNVVSTVPGLGEDYGPELNERIAQAASSLKKRKHDGHSALDLIKGKRYSTESEQEVPVKRAKTSSTSPVKSKSPAKSDTKRTPPKATNEIRSPLKKRRASTGFLAARASRVRKNSPNLSRRRVERRKSDHITTKMQSHKAAKVLKTPSPGSFKPTRKTNRSAQESSTMVSSNESSKHSSRETLKPKNRPKRVESPPIARKLPIKKLCVDSFELEDSDDGRLRVEERASTVESWEEPSSSREEEEGRGQVGVNFFNVVQHTVLLLIFAYINFRNWAKFANVRIREISKIQNFAKISIHKN